MFDYSADKSNRSIIFVLISLPCVYSNARPENLLIFKIYEFEKLNIINIRIAYKYFAHLHDKNYLNKYTLLNKYIVKKFVIFFSMDAMHFQ